MIQEKYLFDSHVVGTTHLEDKTALNKINVGDKLGLLREDDKYDEKAILIITDK